MLLNFSSMVYRPWLMAQQTFSGGFEKSGAGSISLRLFFAIKFIFHPVIAG
jgi:hypothetical protein